MTQTGPQWTWLLLLPTVGAAVTQTLWHNTALAGEQNTTTVVASVGGSWGGDQLLSVEWLATLRAPAKARYTFDCRVANGAVILWLDDHLLCGTDELFAPAPAGGVAPLPPYMLLSAGEPHFLRVHFYHNESSVDPASLALLWGVDGAAPVAVPASALAAAAAPEQLARLAMQAELATGWGTWWRPNALAATLLPEGATATAGLCELASGKCMDPDTAFTPEEGRGPEEPCDGNRCSEGTARPGLHAWDRSYWQLFLSFRGLNVSLEWVGTGAGAGPEEHQTLGLLATVVSGNASGFALALTADFKYNRVGSVAPCSGDGGGCLELAAHGLRTTAVRALTPAVWAQSSTNMAAIAATNTATNGTLRLALGSGHAGVTTESAATVGTLAALQVAVARARTLAAFTLATPSAGEAAVEGAAASKVDLEDGGTAMQAGAMWNVLWHPTQAGPFISVSRSFTINPYEIFEWDTYFGALLLSFDAKSMPLAISSLIQVTKGKTLGPLLDGHGFVPGYSKGGRWLSEDRTERPVGATILRRIWQRWRQPPGAEQFGAVQPGAEQPDGSNRAAVWPSWLLKLLYPDLLDWQKWLWASRRLEPLGLACAGSDPCIVPGGGGSGGEWCKPSWGMGQLQGARFESLDNSPMYDTPTAGYPLWNSTTHKMQLYDVGQTAAMAAEAEALAVLADELGDELGGGQYADDAELLQRRQQTLSAGMNTHMWLEEEAVYSNVLQAGGPATAGKPYPRISPTSFLPLLAGAASDAQATATTTAWITNASRFCVPPDASHWPAKPPPPSLANISCYWGMPSISADDAAFMVAGGTSGIYWRGETWAPQAFLTYEALARYDHLPILRQARGGLAAQQLGLLLSVWRTRHHVCENYASTWRSAASSGGKFESPGAECTGNHFYSWGGLSAFIALDQAGYYSNSNSNSNSKNVNVPNGTYGLLPLVSTQARAEHLGSPDIAERLGSSYITEQLTAPHIAGHSCYYALCIFYYSDWAGGHLVGGGDRGQPLSCPDGNSSLTTEINQSLPDLPDTWYVFHNINHQPGDFYKVWMEGGDVHDATKERVARYRDGLLVNHGTCDFPRRAENNAGNLFTFYNSTDSREDSINLTLCAANQK